MFIGLCYLINDATQFTFFSISLFVCPILIDLFHDNLVPSTPRILRFVRNTYILTNTTVLIFCICGLFGIVIDDGYFFVAAKSNMLLSSISFEKKDIVYFIMANILIPVMYLSGAPNKSALDAANAVIARGEAL